MNNELAAIAKKREMLVARAASQRAELAMLAERWKEPLAAAEAAYRLGRVFRRYPAITAVALVIMARARLVTWSGWLLTGWGLYQAIRKRWQHHDPHAES